MSVLNIELKFFEENKAKWVKIYSDKFVLIKGTELIGNFDTADAAVAEGARVYGGSTAFLVKKVSRTEENVFIPSLSLGLLYAT
jgi:hypothetical protein